LKSSRFSTLSIAALTLAFAADAGAQQKPQAWVLTPNQPIAGGASTNRGVAAPNPRTNVIVPNYLYYPQYQYAPTVFPRDGFTPTYFIPAVLNNGHVYANFGSGYQVVSQSCSSTVSQSFSQYTAGYPAQQGTYYPVYYPYGPVEGSLGYPRKQFVETYVSQYQSTTCYTTDRAGQYIVYRY